ncbi:MAG TPA: hypothetical protein VFT61_08340 [Sphingomicrobium sp.]|nr:hypothetical protein [Sphingomicrobium sp.]
MEIDDIMARRAVAAMPAGNTSYAAKAMPDADGGSGSVLLRRRRGA